MENSYFRFSHRPFQSISFSVRPPSSLKSTNTLIWFLCLLIAAGSWSGCAASLTPASHPEKKTNSAIIVIPGYYGTRLVDESDDRVIWISPSEALFGDQPLTLPVSGLELRNTINLRPDGILDTVRVIPFIYSVDVYGSLLDALRSSHGSNAHVIPFAYDWREDLLIAIRDLDATVRQLQTEGYQDIALVAHSMGGLIVSYYLRYGTQPIESAVETWEGADRVSAVVMGGVPFQGVMNSFRNMNFGVDVKLNRSMLTSEAYASFPSSYYTLPILDSDQMLTPDLQVIQGMIRTPENWEGFAWGLLNDRNVLPAEIAHRRAAYMSFWLRRSQQFLERLRAPWSTQHRHHLRLLYFYAKGTPTLAKGVWLKQNLTGTDSLFFDNREPPASLSSISPTILYEDGDETVTIRSAMLPAAYHKTFQTSVRTYDVGHTELVTDPDIQEDIVSFLERP